MADEPLRLQRRRTRGARLPQGAVCCTRPGRWGNQFRPGGYFKIGDPDPQYRGAMRMAWCERIIRNYKDRAEAVREGYTLITDAAQAVEWFRSYSPQIAEKARAELRGRDLACWCALCPAHADGRPWRVKCEACAPCHCDVLLEIANG